MKITKTNIEGLLIIEPQILRDERGWFYESYNKGMLDDIKADFIQDNHSFSMKKNTLRGIHLQLEPYSQAKLVRCIKGAALDVAVDLRKDSKTYKKWVSVEINQENKKMVFIPKGFGHGFITLMDETEFVYKVDNYYNKDYERTIRYDDKELNIEWGCNNPILSKKDGSAPFLSQL